VFALALSDVETLPSAPIASGLEHYSSSFSINYLEAIRDANTAVRALEGITENKRRLYTNFDDITSPFLSVKTEVIDGV
jgi:hypothetical protein